MGCAMVYSYYSPERDKRYFVTSKLDLNRRDGLAVLFKHAIRKIDKEQGINANVPWIDKNKIEKEK